VITTGIDAKIPGKNNALVFENETNAKQIPKDRALAIDIEFLSIASALSLCICLAFVSFSKTRVFSSRE
jgi:hypothetical protein